MLTIWDLINSIGNGFQAVGATFKDMLYLRMCVVVGLVFIAFYDVNVNTEPQWSDLIWTITIAVINSVQVIIILIERSRLHLNSMELKIYNQVFSQMHKVNFKKLIKDADWIDYQPEVILIEENSLLDKLMLIYEGQVDIKVNSRVVAHLRDGHFIGEMSFITGNKTTATVVTSEPTRIIQWERNKLNTLLEKNPETNSDIQKIFNKDLIDKVLSRNKEVK